MIAVAKAGKLGASMWVMTELMAPSNDAIRDRYSPADITLQSLVTSLPSRTEVRSTAESCFLDGSTVAKPQLRPAAIVMESGVVGAAAWIRLLAFAVDGRLDVLRER